MTKYFRYTLDDMKQSSDRKLFSYISFFSGGGGSSFVGFADNSTSTVLTATGSYGTYVDSTTRTNGTRTYTNSNTTRTADTGRAPYQYNSTYYDQNPADDGGMHVAYGGAVNGEDHGGNGFVSIRY